MGRGAVGTGEPGKCRYQLLLFGRESYWTAGLPLAQWWSDDANELRRQASEGKDCVERQGMYYRLRDNEEGGDYLDL